MHVVGCSPRRRRNCPPVIITVAAIPLASERLAFAARCCCVDTAPEAPTSSLLYIRDVEPSSGRTCVGVVIYVSLPVLPRIDQRRPPFWPQLCCPSASVLFTILLITR